MNNIATTTHRRNLPSFFDREEFLTPFDKIFDQMINTTFPGFFKESGVSFEQGAYPRVNVYDKEDKIKIIAEIPGLTKEDVQVSVEVGILTISGNKHSAFEDENAKVIKRELKQAAFKRSFSLGDNLDSDNVSASFKDGVLDVGIPKLEPEKKEKKFVKIA